MNVKVVYLALKAAAVSWLLLGAVRAFCSHRPGLGIVDIALATWFSLSTWLIIHKARRP